MTTMGIIFVATISIVTFIITFALFARSRERLLDAASYIVGVIVGLFSSFLVLTVSIVLII